LWHCIFSFSTEAEALSNDNLSRPRLFLMHFQFGGQAAESFGMRMGAVNIISSFTLAALTLISVLY